MRKKGRKGGANDINEPSFCLAVAPFLKLVKAQQHRRVCSLYPLVLFMAAPVTKLVL